MSVLLLSLCSSLLALPSPCSISSGPAHTLSASVEHVRSQGSVPASAWRLARLTNHSDTFHVTFHLSTLNWRCRGLDLGLSAYPITELLWSVSWSAHSPPAATQQLWQNSAACTILGAPFLTQQAIGREAEAAEGTSSLPLPTCWHFAICSGTL